MSTTHRTYTAQRSEVVNGKAGLTLTADGETIQTVKPGKRPVSASAIVVTNWADNPRPGIYAYRGTLAAARSEADRLRAKMSAGYLLDVQAVEITD